MQNRFYNQKKVKLSSENVQDFRMAWQIWMLKASFLELYMSAITHNHYTWRGYLMILWGWGASHPLSKCKEFITEMGMISFNSSKLMVNLVRNLPNSWWLQVFQMKIHWHYMPLHMSCNGAWLLKQTIFLDIVLCSYVFLVCMNWLTLRLPCIVIFWT